jgi:hypothetical protein
MMSDSYRSSTWDSDEWERPRRRRGGPFARFRRWLRGRHQEDSEYGYESTGNHWYWPGPLGGTVAVVLIVTVVLALPAVVAASWGRGFPTLPGHAAAPPVAEPGGPTPDFNPPPYPPWETPGADATVPTGIPTQPDAADPATSGGQTGPLPTPLPTPVPTPAGGGTGSRFVAVTGGGCPETRNASYFAAYPAGRPVHNLSGGWAGQGCTDRFWSVPMSGSATDDPATYVLWFFATAPVTRGQCGIWAYVPKGPSDQDVAGNPTFYDVLRARDDRRVIGTFSIKQAPNRGMWAYGGAFTFDGGQIAVRLGNRGSGSGRHGAAQILVNCAAR